jgi:hypothetical protein
VLSEWVSIWLYTGEEPDAMYVIRSGLVSAKAPGQPLQMIGIGNVISLFSNFVGDKICIIIKLSYIGSSLRSSLILRPLLSLSLIQRVSFHPHIFISLELVIALLNNM